MASGLKGAWAHLVQPWTFLRSYRRSNLRTDVVAGVTVGVLLLPQSIALAQIAGLPPRYGLHAAIVGAIVGGLWGSSRQLHTGPTTMISVIVLSSLAPLAAPGSAGFLLAAGLMTVMAGIFQVVMGVARLGILANFVSHSVLMGFMAGAAVLIAVTQLEPLLGLEAAGSGHNVLAHLGSALSHLHETHLATALLGVSTLVFLILMRRFAPRLPAALLAMVGCGLAVAVASLADLGVAVIGALPRSLPPVASLDVFDLDLIGKLSTGALAVAAIGLTESVSIARAVASETDQRLDPNQELVGQGLSNVACGVFSGFAVAGSFSRTAVAYRAGARTQMAALVSSAFVLLVVLAFAPLAATIPKAALAGVLIVTAAFMVNVGEIRRIWSGPRGDRLVMVATFAATLFLPIEFAVIIGMLISFGLYVARTSTPKVHSVLPNDAYNHLEPRPDQSECPQLVIFDVHGDLYFGAVTQVEERILGHLDANPEQRFVLLRMHSVNQCDFSGIHCLEHVLRVLRERGGDLYLTRVHPSVMKVMERTGFCAELGEANYLSEQQAIGHLFHRVLDPAVCIYECPIRAFRECQNLPKRLLETSLDLPEQAPREPVPEIEAVDLWDDLRGLAPPRVIDVREPREYRRRHIVEAELCPLPQFLESPPPADGRPWVLVCRGGRRSARAAAELRARGRENLSVLRGGMLAWEAAGLIDAVDPTKQHTPVRPPLIVSEDF